MEHQPKSCLDPELGGQCEETGLREALRSWLWPPHLPLVVELSAVVLDFLGANPSCGTKDKLLRVSVPPFPHL